MVKNSVHDALRHDLSNDRGKSLNLSVKHGAQLLRLLRL